VMSPAASRYAAPSALVSSTSAFEHDLDRAADP
jgi:hypothetical protein